MFLTWQELLLCGKTHPNDHKQLLPRRSEIDGVRLDQGPKNARRVSREEKGKGTWDVTDLNNLNCDHTARVSPGRELFELKPKVAQGAAAEG